MKKYLKPSYLIGGLLALALLGSVATLINFLPTLFSHDPMPAFPGSGSGHTVVLKPPQSGEALRLIDVTPEGRRLAMRIEYKDGSTAVVTFTAGGRASNMKEYYALSPADQAKMAMVPKVVQRLDYGLALRKLYRVTEFDKDGLTIKSQVVYRMSGSVKESAVLSVDGDLVVSSYFDNRSGVERIQVFAKGSGKLKGEQVFRPDGGSLSSVLTTEGIGGADARLDYINLNGKVFRSVLFISSYQTEVTDFADDGVTKLQSVTYGYYSVSVTLYDKATGKPSLDRSFFDGGNTIVVKYYDPQTTRVLVQQRWVKLDPAVKADRVGITNDGFVLDTVTENYDNGYNTKLELQFYPGGKYVKTAQSRKRVSSWGTYTQRNYKSDGTLESTEEYEYSSVKNRVPAPAGSTDREPLPAYLTKKTPLLPVYDKTDESAPKLSTRSLTVNLD